METSYPGVYVEEVSSGIKPVTSVSTSTAAFIGEAEKGPVDKALLVTSVLEFQHNYGNHLKDLWLSHCVQQFFANGGSRLYIARVIPQSGSATAEQDYQQAFALLDAIEDLNLVAVPGVATPSMIRYGAEYCQKRKDCFFIGEMALSDDSARKAGDFIKQLNCRCSYGAVYFPWLKLKAVRRASAQPLFIPPSGAIAGLYARTDAVRGVWKAPAGAQASLNGVVGLSVNLSDREQDMLNPTGVNVIREFPAHGIVAWGARTLGTQTDPEFRYVPVRRTAIYLQQSIYKSIGWAVFEPNDENLWRGLRLTIENFLTGLFRAGAFQGQTQDQAFFVKCDSETTTQIDIDTGMVNLVVGFAPLKPAEFVMLKFSQKTGVPARAGST